MRIVLVRHGESWGDVESLGEANLAVGLTPAGADRARRVAEYLALRERNVAAVFSSPVERARETAESIALALRKPVVTVPEFAEAYLGQWEGKSQREIRRAFPDEVASFFKDPEAFQFPGGETMTAFLDRTSAGLRRAIDASSGKTLIIITHWVVIAFWVCRFLDRPSAEFLTYEVPNCGITVFEGGGLRSLKLVGQIGTVPGSDVQSVVRFDTAFWTATFAIAFTCLLLVANQLIPFSATDPRVIALTASLLHWSRYWMKFGFKWARFLPALSGRHQGINVLIMVVGCASILAALAPPFLFAAWAMLYTLVWVKYRIALREATTYASPANIDWLKCRLGRVWPKLAVSVAFAAIGFTVGDHMLGALSVLFLLLCLNAAYGLYGVVRDAIGLFWASSEVAA